MLPTAERRRQEQLGLGRGAQHRPGGIEDVAHRRRRLARPRPHHRPERQLGRQLTLLATLLHCRGREVIDRLVGLLIATVQRINARAEQRVVKASYTTTTGPG